MKRGPKSKANPTKGALWKRMQRRVRDLTDDEELLKQFDDLGQIFHDHMSDRLDLHTPRWCESVDKPFLKKMTEQVAIEQDAERRIAEIRRETEARIAAVWRHTDDKIDDEKSQIMASGRIQQTNKISPVISLP
jgi:hypothetical protein